MTNKGNVKYKNKELKKKFPIIQNSPSYKFELSVLINFPKNNP